MTGEIEIDIIYSLFCDVLSKEPVVLIPTCPTANIDKQTHSQILVLSTEIEEQKQLLINYVCRYNYLYLQMIGSQGDYYHQGPPPATLDQSLYKDSRPETKQLEH